MHQIQYREDFETENPAGFWTARGDYRVDFAGLTTERSHCGTQSFKLDITFLGDSHYNYWDGPVLDIPAVAGTRFTGHIYLEQVPPNVSVSLGCGFFLPAMRETGAGEGRGSRVALGSFTENSETGRWYRQTSDVRLAAEGMSRKLLGQLTPGLRFEKWHINISCREATDARLVIYIDDIAIEGGTVPDDWAEKEELLLRQWSVDFEARMRVRANRFHRALAPMHAEALAVSQELATVRLPGAQPETGWQPFASGMLEEARNLAQELVARTTPDLEPPAEDKALEVHLHDLRDRWVRPLRWAIDHVHRVWRRERPYLLSVANDPITNHRILPTSRLLTGAIDGEIDLFACPGESQPACFSVVPAEATTATFEVSELRGGGGTIPARCLDLKAVKVWYQAGIELNEVDRKILTPELLLKDDELVQVDLERQENRVRDIDHPGDAEELLPVPVPAGASRQFWLTVHVPEAAAPGIYRGSVLIRLDGLAEHRLPVRMEVLPIQLAAPALHYGLYYRGILSRSERPQYVSSELKTEPQLEAEFRNMKEHGILYPDVYQLASLRADGTLDADELGRYLDIRDRAGLPRDKLFYNGSSVDAADTEEESEARVEFCRQLIDWARARGVQEVYFFGSDEAFGEQLVQQRRIWSRVRELGGKMAVACSTGFFELVGDLLDLPIVARMSPEEVPRVHAAGHKICNYSMPQGGVEQPFMYRYFFGHWLLRSGMDGSRTYAYQHGYGPGGSMGRPWDDFDNPIYRSHMLAYPTVDGVVDTLQWEGVREAVDDVRYATTLRHAIEAARDSGVRAAVALAQAAETWLDEADIVGDLHSIRRETADRIIALNRAVAEP